MDKREFATLAAALKTYYPKENLLPNRQAMELWFRQLQDIPYIVAEAALNKWVATNKWSPSIADIRQTAATITMGENPSWSYGWEQVQRAIRMYGTWNISAAMESLDEITREAVKRLGLRELCMSENVTADRANFRMIYDQIAERRNEQQCLPSGLKNLISEMQKRGIDNLERKRIPTPDFEAGQVDRE